MTGDLTVATFNIHGGVGRDRVLDLGRIADLLGNTGASVIALQEVNRYPAHGEVPFDDQADVIAAHLGMTSSFGPNVRYAADHRLHPGREYGVALLTGLPVLDHRHSLLPRPARTEQRGLVDVRVSWDGRPLRVVCTHLQNADRTTQLLQADALVEHLGLTGHPTTIDEPTVVLGDLNADPRSPAYRRLSAHLTDAWLQAGRGRGHTFGPRWRRSRIDHVLLGGPVRATAARVWGTRASDHDLLTVDLRLAHG